MLKTLDRYIIRQFLGTFFFILVVIMLIAVVFDISEKTEDFATMNAPRTGDRLRLLLSTS
jgi:lipopolysaccharide export system permease protein